MKIQRKSVRSGAACNFCDKAKLSGSGDSLVYPYSEITEISAEKGSGYIRLCDDCLAELTEKTKRA